MQFADLPNAVASVLGAAPPAAPPAAASAARAAAPAGVPVSGAPSRPPDEPARRPDGPSALDRVATVLLIDDEALIRLGLAAALEAAGWRVLTAAQVAEAERAASAPGCRPDALVADLHLGRGGDGLEAVGRIREIAGADLPAVLLTGDDDPAVAEAAAQAGCRLLRKPASPRELRRILEEISLRRSS